MAEADGVQFPNALHQQPNQVDDQYPQQVDAEQGGVVALVALTKMAQRGCCYGWLGF